MSLETIPSLVSVSTSEANEPIDTTELPDPLVSATTETGDANLASNEADFEEACGFIWPESHFKQALIDARISQLAIMWQKSSNRRDRDYASLEREILLVFEKKRHLNMIEDIYLPIEEYFGITPVDTIDEARREHGPSNLDLVTINQATIADCHNLVVIICRSLEDTLGVEGLKSKDNTGSETQTRMIHETN